MHTDFRHSDKGSMNGNFFIINEVVDKRRVAYPIYIYIYFVLITHSIM